MVRAAPRMRAKRTSTPPSPSPQKALQKSRLRGEVSGDVVRAYFASDVVDDCRLADMMFARRGWSQTQQMKYTAMKELQGAPAGSGDDEDEAAGGVVPRGSVLEPHCHHHSSNCHHACTETHNIRARFVTIQHDARLDEKQTRHKQNQEHLAPRRLCRRRGSRRSSRWLGRTLLSSLHILAPVCRTESGCTQILLGESGQIDHKEQEEHWSG